MSESNLPTEPAVPEALAEPAPEQAGPGWERELVTRLAYAALLEQRRTRRWGLVFKFALLVYLVVVLVLYTPSDLLPGGGSDRHTALVDVKGVISDDGEASADRVVSGLRAAFEDEETVGVILRINSPGGSPVQSDYINSEIGRLRAKHPDTPLFAVITDMAASGGYYVAAAADGIYANPASVVGSIGVLMNGFGFVGAMERLGIERRLLTAGEHKGLLDPFSPIRPAELSHIHGLLEEIHGQFIAAVKRGRGDRLSDDDKLFSGLIWTGEEGLQLGLVDGMGSTGYVAREVIGAEEIVDFTRTRGYLDRLAQRFGSAIARGAVEALGLEPRLD